MDSLKYDNIKTHLQQFILELAHLQKQISLADTTFIALIPNSINKELFESPEEFNEHFMEKFLHAIHGKHEEEFTIDSYQKIDLQDIVIYTKEFTKNNRLIRMIFIPTEQYDLSNDKVGPVSYVKMVKKFFLLNLYMKESVTEKIKLIAMDFIPKPASGLKGKLKGINIFEHVKSLFEDLRQNYNLEYLPEMSKLSFVFSIEEVREPLIFTSGEMKMSELKEEILILTHDETIHPVYRLDENLKLSSDETVLTETKNVVEVKNYHLLFHYNRFTTYTTELVANNILDRLTSNEIWGVIETIIYPLFRVKQLISNHYQLPEEEGKTKKIYEDLEAQRWDSPKLLKNDFFKFNELFDENQWIETHENVHVDDQEQVEMRENRRDQRYEDEEKNIKNKETPNPIQENRLLSYTQHFTLYARFLKQQPNFIHSMVLDQINELSKYISDSAEEIHKAINYEVKKQTEMKVLELTKIIVRFLAQLKQHPIFSSHLEFYNPEFNEYLLDVYLSAYSEFCSAYKEIYGKLFDLSQKVADLKSTKKQILKVVKSVGSFTQLYKIHTYAATLDDLEDKRLLLEILLRLLEENKSEEKNKEIDTKIMSTQYDLGSTYLKIALITEYGHTQSVQLKVGLKILYNDLYLKLFILRKDFDKEFANMVNFNELELLEKISGLLKLLDSIDLAIEVEKKLENVTTVENYYNRWMMKYHRLHGKADQEQIVAICLKAIEYFSTKFEVDKVIHYYDLLIKNSLTFEEKSQWKTKRFKYLNSTRDADFCKKGMEKAEKTLYPISEETSKAIHALYVDILPNSQ